MKLIYPICCLLFVSQLFCTENASFFQTLRTDIRACIKGTALPEQKERIIKQGAVVLMAFGVSIYCVAAWGAIGDGQPVPPIQLGQLKFAKHLGSRQAYRAKRTTKNRRRRNRVPHTLSGKQELSEIPEELGDFFTIKMP